MKRKIIIFFMIIMAAAFLFINKSDAITESEPKVDVELHVDGLKDGDVLYSYDFENEELNKIVVSGYVKAKIKRTWARIGVDGKFMLQIKMGEYEEGKGYIENSERSDFCTYDKEAGTWDHTGFYYDTVYNFINPNYPPEMQSQLYPQLNVGEHTLNIIVYGYDGDDYRGSDGNIDWNKFEEIYTKDIHFKIEDAPEASDYILGDVDGSGKVDIKDAIMVLQYSSEKIQLTEEQKEAANVDKTSSDVNIKDAIKILQYTSEN